MNVNQLKPAARQGRISVHLHGFINLPDGGQECCDIEEDIDGWAVYIREETPQDPQQPFDIHEVSDRPTYEAAEKVARGIAEQLLGDAEDWELD